jgi:hypothetical protein
MKQQTPPSASASSSAAAQQSPDEEELLLLLQRKIGLVTEGFTSKSSELILSDRSRLSTENALTVCNYLLDMKREINPKPTYVKSTIQFLSELSRHVGIEKKFVDIIMESGGSKDNNNNNNNAVLQYLDTCRKSENDDPLHRWIGTFYG